MLADSGSVASFVPEDLAEMLVRKNPKLVTWDRTQIATGLRSFTKDVVESRGVLYTRMEFAGWVVKRGSVHVVPKGYRTILGDNYFQQFGLKLTQTSRSGGKQILQIEGDPSTVVIQL